MNDNVKSIRAQVASHGALFNPTILQATRDIYRPYIPAGGDIRTEVDVAYGSAARHRLDLYRPAATTAANVPIVIYIHGGGFVGGGKNEDGVYYRNGGEYFARHGFLAIVPNYRLAPEHPWPAGAQDVGAVVDWAGQNASRYGADPARRFIIGQSAGSTHVATWLFDGNVRGTAAPAVTGAVLMSGLYRVEAPLDPRLQSYFGADPALYPARSPIAHVAKDHPPLLLSVAEFDPAFLARSTFDLAQRLTEVDGRSPRFAWMDGHNHVSTVQSLGSPQDECGAGLLAFFRSL